MRRAWLTSVALLLSVGLQARTTRLRSLGSPASYGGQAHVTHTTYATQTDLDAFMRDVLATRDENWKKLQQYVLDERESIELRGPGRTPMWGERRDYTWFIRDGFFVRSPLRVNGVAIGEADRRRYEADFLAREQRRERRRAGGAAEPAAPAAVHLFRLFPAVPVRRRPVRAGRPRDARRARGPEDRVLPDESLPRHRSAPDRTRALARGQGLRRRIPSADEQDGAGDVVGRAGRAPDREVH